MVDAPGYPGRRPGLLAQWRRESATAGWFGLVVLVNEDGAGHAVLVQAWIAALYLSPV